MIVPKTMVTSANKIVSLSGRGIAVTSENVKYLVRYLADVENANEEHITVQYSTSKLGWIRGGFLPYDTDIVFDGDARYRQIHESVGQAGSRTAWFDHVSALRKAGRIEVKFMLAAAFSSVLVQPLGGLPYFVDLWGETEGGKTVSLMVAASVWADSDESAYIKDYKGTEVGLEAICDLLNNLPLILDDSSKKNRKIEDNFEGLVYDLCSGKGKTRSNKDLGLNRENHWKNCILTNGERPLSSYVTQGGAINRILEIECGERVFDSPGSTAELVKHNYGHAGREFIEVIKELGTDKIREIHQDFSRQLANDEKMQKQSLSLSIVLTADKIATDYGKNKDECLKEYEALDTIIPEIYESIEQDESGMLCTTGAQRTGCSMCGFGIHMEKRPHRFDKLRERNPKEWEFWMYRCCVDKESGEKFGWGKVLDYIGVGWEDCPENT